MCDCYVVTYTKSGYNIIPGIYILTELVLYLELSNHVITRGYAPFERRTAPKVDLVTHTFKNYTKVIFHQKNPFTNAYA